VQRAEGMYRAATEQLEAKLARLRSDRAEILADIERCEAAMDAGCRPRRRAQTGCGVAVGLTLGLLALVALHGVHVVSDRARADSTRGRADAVLAGVGAWAEGRHRRSRVDSSRVGVATLRSAATLYLSQSPGGGCPTVEDLVAEGFVQLGDDTTLDGWGHPFRVECDGYDVRVVSECFDGERVVEGCE